MKRFINFLLRTYLFISSASFCLVLATYLLSGQPLKITAVSVLAFFCTLLIYNLHKVSNLFNEISFSVRFLLTQFKKISFLTKTMIIISLIGILSTIFFIQAKTLLCLFPLALLTLAYSIPFIKVNGKRKRLREILFVKIMSLSLVWAFATVWLPLVDCGVNIFSKSSLAIFTERFLFMYAICVPFEIRDMEQEKKWGIKTMPQEIGVNASKISALIALLVFIALCYFQFENSMDNSKHIFFLPLFLSAAAAFGLILFSNEKRGSYYFRIFIDGTMQLQFILLLLFR